MEQEKGSILNFEKDICLKEILERSRKVIGYFLSTYDIKKFNPEDFENMNLRSIYETVTHEDTKDKSSEIIRFRIIATVESTVLLTDSARRVTEKTKSKKVTILDLGKKTLKSINIENLFSDTMLFIISVKQIIMIKQIIYNEMSFNTYDS